MNHDICPPGTWALLARLGYSKADVERLATWAANRHELRPGYAEEVCAPAAFEKMAVTELRMDGLQRVEFAGIPFVEDEELAIDAPDEIELRPGGSNFADQWMLDFLAGMGFRATRTTEKVAIEGKEVAGGSLSGIYPLPGSLHASAPAGMGCADCAIDGEACPDCYSAWWSGRHPNVELNDDAALLPPWWLVYRRAEAVRMHKEGCNG